MLAGAAPARAQSEYAGGEVRKSSVTLSSFLRRFDDARLFGVGSFNWRNVGPKQPGFETQIQDEVYLADLYFGAEIPLYAKVPFYVEFNVPTQLQGQVQLYQIFVENNRLEQFKFQVGKFVVPYGRYNELYRPDAFLAVTRPLLYASPDSIDLVVRPNSPVPPVSVGYSDLGARASWYPGRDNPFVPDEMTVFVVNGLGESDNRSRTFPNPQNLGITGVPTNGVALDFGHQNNNLADNNNAKSIGVRAVFGLGDLSLPWPFPERASDLDGVILSFSGMGGTYDLEGQLQYQMWALDWSFDYHGISISGEAEYEVDQFKNPLMLLTSTDLSPVLVTPVTQATLREENYGYFVQAAFPVMRRPPFGERLTGVLVFNQIYRRGPQLDFLLNVPDPANGGALIPSMTAFKSNSPNVQTQIEKISAALNHKLTDHFTLKFEYSYWFMGKATILSPTSLGAHDIYQTALSLVVGF